MALTLGGPLLGFLYYGLIPSGSLEAGCLQRCTAARPCWRSPALLNMVFGVAITPGRGASHAHALITGLGLVWVATPAIQVLPFEFPGVQPREVAVLTGLILTFMGVGFAIGPMLVGVVAQLTGSIQTGLISLSL